MSEPAELEVTEEVFLAKVADICAASASLTQLGAAVLLAADLGIATDSRSFSRILGLEHALVLRAVTELAATDASLLLITDRNERTQRTKYALTDPAKAILASAHRPA